MIPLQTPPPIIPDKTTLELLIGPYGALVLMAIVVSALGWLVWWLIGKSVAKDEMINKMHADNGAAISKLHGDHAEKLLNLQREYATKLEALLRETAGKLENMNERLIKGDLDATASARELTGEIRGLANLIRAALKLP